MPTLTITKSYDDGSVLTEAHLDAIKDSIEAFVNSTKLDSDNIQAGGVSAANLASNSVVAAKIDTGAVETAKLADGAVTTLKIADDNITTDKLADDSVTADKIADDSVTTDKIADSNITTDKIADSNVTTAKIAAANVTNAKLANPNYAVSGASGTFDTTSSSYTDVTNLSVSITTVANRHVEIGLIPSSEGASIVGFFNAGVDQFCEGTLAILEDGNAIAEIRLSTYAVTTNLAGFGPGSVRHVRIAPSAGSHTYKVQIRATVGTSARAAVYHCRLYVREV